MSQISFDEPEFFQHDNADGSIQTPALLNSENIEPIDIKGWDMERLGNWFDGTRGKIIVEYSAHHNLACLN